MDPKNFTHICTYRTKFYRMTAAVSLAACTCALGLPSAAFAANQTPAATNPAPVPASAPVATPSHTSTPASPETPAQSKDDSLTWTRDDFNISADGKTIGLTGLNKTDGYPGLNAKGVAKLKKNPHVVIPDGVEVILKDAFLGKLDQPGNKYKTNESYIEGVTLPKSLKLIEYGAFAWNKIKGTVVIPKSVVSIHAGAFISNQIERVVFEGVIDGKGKLKESDSEPYYVAGIGSKAFQGNRITDIVVPGNFADMKLRFDNTNPRNPDPGPFDNQEYDTTTIEVGEAFTSPLTIHQAGNKQEKISGMGGFMENGTPTLIAYSSYFDSQNGAYVAKKTGTIQGQWMLYDVRNGINSPLGTLHFTYEILPKGSLCTVTFNDDDAVVGSVRVRKGKSIAQGAVNGQVMPANPVKTGATFKGWYVNIDGTGDAFTAATVVNSDLVVHAVYSKNPEPKPEPPKPKPEPEPKPKPKPEPAPAPTPYPLPVPEVPAPTPAPAPAPEHNVPALEVPAPKTPATPAEAPVPVVRKHVRTLPQTGDPMAISAVGELGMMLGILSASLAAILRRKRR